MNSTPDGDILVYIHADTFEPEARVYFPAEMIWTVFLFGKIVYAPGTGTWSIYYMGELMEDPRRYYQGELMKDGEPDDVLWEIGKRFFFNHIDGSLMRYQTEDRTYVWRLYDHATGGGAEWNYYLGVWPD